MSETHHSQKSNRFGHWRRLFVLWALVVPPLAILAFGILLSELLQAVESVTGYDLGPMTGLGWAIVIFAVSSGVPAVICSMPWPIVMGFMGVEFDNWPIDHALAVALGLTINGLILAGFSAATEKRRGRRRS